MFVLVERRVGIKFICVANFGQKIITMLNYNIITKFTKAFAYVEDTKACNNSLDKLAVSTTNFGGEHHLHYLTHADQNTCAIVVD